MCRGSCRRSIRRDTGRADLQICPESGSRFRPCQSPPPPPLDPAHVAHFSIILELIAKIGTCSIFWVARTRVPLRASKLQAPAARRGRAEWKPLLEVAQYRLSQCVNYAGSDLFEIGVLILRMLKITFSAVRLGRTLSPPRLSRGAAVGALSSPATPPAFARHKLAGRPADVAAAAASRRWGPLLTSRGDAIGGAPPAAPRPTHPARPGGSTRVNARQLARRYVGGGKAAPAAVAAAHRWRV